VTSNATGLLSLVMVGIAQHEGTDYAQTKDITQGVIIDIQGYGGTRV
jgi:hypothetical protein